MGSKSLGKKPGQNVRDDLSFYPSGSIASLEFIWSKARFIPPCRSKPGFTIISYLVADKDPGIYAESESYWE